MITGRYNFKIWYEDGYYVAKCWLPDGTCHYTNGTHEDIFYMVADLYATCFDIKIPLWKRWLIRLFKLY